jgi:hypothetical protein
MPIGTPNIRLWIAQEVTAISFPAMQIGGSVRLALGGG